MALSVDTAGGSHLSPSPSPPPSNVLTPTAHLLHTLSPPTLSALALRAQVLCELQRPTAAICDADRALELNADSAPALRWRGKAKALKGDWCVHRAVQRRSPRRSFAHAPPPSRLGANRDMASAQQIDFSEDVAEWLKQVGGNARKVGPGLAGPLASPCPWPCTL